MNAPNPIRTFESDAAGLSRLIAAPELYSNGERSALTLREMAKILRASGRSGCGDMCDAAASAMESALAKARGEPAAIVRGANGQSVALLQISGRTVEVDVEIAPIVAALNAAGVTTKASCSGHGYRPANIALADGREIIIARSHAEARRIEALFPLDINGGAA